MCRRVSFSQRMHTKAGTPGCTRDQMGETVIWQGWVSASFAAVLCMASLAFYLAMRYGTVKVAISRALDVCRVFWQRSSVL